MKEGLMSELPVRLSRPGRSAEHPLITVAETARMLGYSDMTIRRRIDARRFPAVKIGSKAMVPRAFVERLLAAAQSGRTVVVEEIAAQWAAEEAGEGALAPIR
jgi:excisionase family DNA binding protein